MKSTNGLKTLRCFRDRVELVITLVIFPAIVSAIRPIIVTNGPTSILIGTVWQFKLLALSGVSHWWSMRSESHMRNPDGSSAIIFHLKIYLLVCENLVELFDFTQFRRTRDFALCVKSIGVCLVVCSSFVISSINLFNMLARCFGNGY